MEGDNTWRELCIVLAMAWHTVGDQEDTLGVFILQQEYINMYYVSPGSTDIQYTKICNTTYNMHLGTRLSKGSRRLSIKKR